jgi:hypothetical protein
MEGPRNAQSGRQGPGAQQGRPLRTPVSPESVLWRPSILNAPSALGALLAWPSPPRGCTSAMRRWWMRLARGVVWCQGCSAPSTWTKAASTAHQRNCGFRDCDRQSSLPLSRSPWCPHRPDLADRHSLTRLGTHLEMFGWGLLWVHVPRDL